MCVTLLCGALFAVFYNIKKVNAYTGTSIIANIFDDNANTFVYDNLNALAIAAGFSSFNNMEALAEQGITKTSADFGGKTVKFGKYTTKQNTQAELIWTPVYLSKSSDGDAILTLWLSSTQSANTSSNQEVSSISDGTMCFGSGPYSGSRPYSENGNTYTVQSETYDSSYLRHVMLLGDYNYAENFGYRFSSGSHRGYSHPANKIVLPNGTVTNPPTLETLNKFSDFQSGGKFSKYIVAPEKISWQTVSRNSKNDVGYKGSYAARYPTNWLKDNIWLPSKSEAIANGIWNTSAAMRGGTISTWLRNGSEASTSSHCCGALSP